MSLGVGGAETHILELALELAGRGIDVHVASNGGYYADALKSAGVTHHQIPMHERRAVSMLKSFFLMRKLIKREKPDIVHAHARIPGFICGLLHKMMRFTFVTTAHFDFEVGHGLRYLTNWGQKTLAVSQDIRHYLIEYYNLAPDDIIVTVNGVDTERFSPVAHRAGYGEDSAAAPGSEDGTAASGAEGAAAHGVTTAARIAEELGLDLTRPVIVSVSRMDENAALTARLLIDIASGLNSRIPGIQLVIAGDGNIFGELCAKAAAVNESTGMNTVIMTGMRTDIEDILSVADVFAGVSRAALEALSEAVPVILSGNEGFIGLFTPEKEQIAVSTNFTCRNCAEPSQDLLFDEIISFFETVSVSERRKLGLFGRELILSDYSVKRMADDCLAAYEAASYRVRSIVMSGYYGYKNAGDEAILKSVHQNIIEARSDVAVTVLSSDPADTMSRFDCGAVHRFSIFRVLRAIRNCDVLISGGGSLLQDLTSTRSLRYYLFIINAARRRGKKVMIYSNGIGPVRKKGNRRKVARVVNRADVITLRDSASADELRSMGVTRGDIRITADPVFSIRRPPDSDIAQILAKYGLPEAPFLSVAIRDWPGTESFSESVAYICDKVYEQSGREIVFISMQSDADTDISQRVRDMMKNPSYIICEQLSVDDLMCIIGASDAVLGMRLHSLIFAARANVPFAGLVYDPKVSAFTDAMSMPSAGDVARLDRNQALETVLQLIKHRAEYSETLRQKTALLEEAVAEDTALLLSLLG